MGFRLGDIADKTENGILRGIQREIACECWFTSRGQSIPKLIKVMDEEGVVHTINEVRLLTVEEKIYAGIPTVEHLCQVNLGGRMETVKLVFTKENCKWTIVAV